MIVFTRFKKKSILMRVIVCFFILYLIFTSFFLYCFQAIIFPKYEEQILSEGQLSCNMIEKQFENTILNLMSDFNYRFFTDTSNDTSFWVNLQSQTITLKDSLNMINYLRHLTAENSFLYTIDVYFEKSNQILSSKFGLKTNSQQNRSFFPWITSGISEQVGIRLSDYTATLSYTEPKPKIITFSQVLKLQYNGIQEHCIVSYSITKDNLVDLLNITETEFPIFLTDSNDHKVLLTQAPHAEQPSINKANKQIQIGNQNFLPCSSSGESSFQVVKWIPISEISTSTHDLNFIFRIGLIVIFGISLGWGILVITHLYTPWKKLLSTLKHDKAILPNSNDNEYNQIVQIFQNLNYQVNHLENTLKENQIIVKNNFLLSLLKGELRQPDVLEKKLKMSQLSFPHKNFLVFEINFKEEFLEKLEPIEFQFIKASLQNHIQRASTSVCQYVTVEFHSHTLSAIACFSNCDIFSQLDNLFYSQPETEYLFPKAAVLSVGSIQSGLEHVSDSKKDSETALEYYYFHPQQSIFFYEELKTLSTIQVIPDSIVRRWNACIKKADIKQLVELFESIALELCHFDYQISCSKPYLEQIFWDFYRCIQNYCEQFSIQPVQVDILPDNYKELIHLVDVIYQDWTAHQNSIKENRKQILVQNAIDYIHQNIHAPLSLEEVASHIYISSTYLSKIFPEITGNKFNEYVNTTKMEKAAELLIQTQNNIETIAQLLGFTNANYFIRRFKQYYGVTPTLYRSNHIQDNNS